MVNSRVECIDWHPKNRHVFWETLHKWGRELTWHIKNGITNQAKKWGCLLKNSPNIGSCIYIYIWRHVRHVYPLYTSVTWLIHMCASYTSVTWLIHMCDMSHSHGRSPTHAATKECPSCVLVICVCKWACIFIYAYTHIYIYMYIFVNI